MGPALSLRQLIRFVRSFLLLLLLYLLIFYFAEEFARASPTDGGSRFLFVFFYSVSFVDSQREFFF